MYNKNSINYRKKETKAALAKKERRRNSRAEKQRQYYRNQVNKNGQNTQQNNNNNNRNVRRGPDVSNNRRPAEKARPAIHKKGPRGKGIPLDHRGYNRESDCKNHKERGGDKQREKERWQGQSGRPVSREEIAEKARKQWRRTGKVIDLGGGRKLLDSIFKNNRGGRKLSKLA